MRQFLGLFDEYQSKENAKHTLRAMRENARQDFWNGARPPFGYDTISGPKAALAKAASLSELPPAGTMLPSFVREWRPIHDKTGHWNILISLR